MERPEFDRIRAGARSGPEPRQTIPTHFPWRNESGPVLRYPTPSRSTQVQHKLTWYRSENVGATPSPGIPVESTPRTPIRPRAEGWSNVNRETTFGPWRGRPQAGPSRAGSNGNRRGGPPVYPNNSGNLRSQNQGTVSHIQPSGICPVGTESKHRGGIIMMSLTISDPAGPGRGTKILTGARGPISFRV